MEEKFFLTFDLKILYFADAKFSSNVCKELNVDNFSLSQYVGNSREMLNAYPLESDAVEDIVKYILTCPIGEELPPENMEWVIKFEELLKKDVSLLTNRDLAFNYFILKFILLGFSHDMAKDIVITYYDRIIKNEEVPHPQILLNRINDFLEYKKFWIKYDLKNERLVEFKMLKNIIKSRIELGHNFNFDTMFKDEYLNIIRNSFVPKLVYFNQTPSYLVKGKLELNTQIPYIVQVYQEMLLGMINKIYEIDNIPFDEMFVNNLLNEMTSVVKLYLNIHKNDFQ